MLITPFRVCFSARSLSCLLQLCQAQKLKVARLRPVICLMPSFLVQQVFGSANTLVVVCAQFQDSPRQVDGQRCKKLRARVLVLYEERQAAHEPDTSEERRERKAEPKWIKRQVLRDHIGWRRDTINPQNHGYLNH